MVMRLLLMKCNFSMGNEHSFYIFKQFSLSNFISNQTIEKRHQLGPIDPVDAERRHLLISAHGIAMLLVSCGL